MSDELLRELDELRSSDVLSYPTYVRLHDLASELIEAREQADKQAEAADTYSVSVKEEYEEHRRRTDKSNVELRIENERLKAEKERVWERVRKLVDDLDRCALSAGVDGAPDAESAYSRASELVAAAVDAERKR